MRSRRLILYAVRLAVLLVPAGGVLFVVFTRDRISPASVGSIRPGMTEAEVEAVFGGPAVSSEPQHVVDRPTMTVVPSGRVIKIWKGRNRAAYVIFGPDGRVEYARLSESAPPDFRDWLARQWGW
jgi:hypothetical protein